MNGLGGGYLLSPAGGIGEKSLLTRGCVGGVYFFGVWSMSTLFSAFLGAGSFLTYRMTCLMKKAIPAIHSPMTVDSYGLRPKPISRKVETAKSIPRKG